VRCPGCGNSLSHKDLQRKRCSGCNYILPVIDSKDRNDGGPARKQTLNPALPPPRRKPLSLEMNAMGEQEEFQAGEVYAVQSMDEPEVPREPSIATEGEDPGIMPPRPAATGEAPLPKTPPRPHPRGPRRQHFDRTIKVNMRELPSVEQIRKQNKKKFYEDLLLIVIIIISFLALTAILIMYLK